MKRSGPIKRRKPMRKAKAKAKPWPPTEATVRPLIMAPELYDRLRAAHPEAGLPPRPQVPRGRWDAVDDAMIELDRSGARIAELHAAAASATPADGYRYPHPMAAVPDWRTSTTARRPGTAQAKLPAVLSPTLLAWVRQQPCELPYAVGHSCEPHPGGDSHHVPTTGSNGRQIDDLVVACCRLGHQLAHAGTIDAQAVEAAAHRTMVRFRRLAPLDVQQRVAAEIVACLYNEGG